MSIYTKLLEIQKKHLAFEKDTSNPFFKSKYVSLDSIVEKLTPILDEFGLVVIHYTENNEVVTMVTDTDIREDEDLRFIDSIKSRFPLIDSNDPQKLWSCISYAKRYNLSQIFNIITDRDDDWNEASDKVVEHKQKSNKTSSALEKHDCRACGEEVEVSIFEWQYWPCFKCPKCNKYSKPNPVN